ncbi:YutD family protein [Periweissella ghanensis]|uniref:DUF1027 domain-containing protein n=1 Tax=Periweissella ghanensis TaxID=467997 RepID=A0ABM8ZAG1_9LACO|nr:YutD family protein [Periweissella ghanensis]MCM0600645.1 YutD family protein [Periweissella ghanensis]CAH0418465.1 hypothetical protein WGH24286_00883 [Periweissella ghanensis]
MDRESLKIKAEAQVSERAATTEFKNTGTNEFIVNGLPMTILRNYRDAFDELKFKARFSDILTKYDYIVGDIAADQLRLKGFYASENNNMTKINSIDAFEDYLLEYMNFGAPYFVIQNQNPVASKTDFELAGSGTNNRRRKRNNRSSHGEETSVNKESNASKTNSRKNNGPRGNATSKNNPKNTNPQNSNSKNANLKNATGQNNNRDRNTGETPTNKRRRRPNPNNQRAEVKEVKKPINDGKGVKKPDGSMSASTKKPNQRKRHFTIQQKNEK